MSLKANMSELQGFSKTNNEQMERFYYFTPDAMNKVTSHLNFHVLPYRPARITVCEILDKFIMTGPMSGCYLCTFELNGKSYLCHLGTGSKEGFQKENDEMKAAWKYAIKNTPLKDVQITYWSPKDDLMNDSKVKEIKWTAEAKEKVPQKYFYGGVFCESKEQIGKYSIAFSSCVIEAGQTQGKPPAQGSSTSKNFLKMFRSKAIKVEHLGGCKDNLKLSGMILKPGTERPLKWLDD